MSVLPHLYSYSFTNPTLPDATTGAAAPMGVGPIEVLPNDRVVVLVDGRMPFILRPQAKNYYIGTDGAEHRC